MDAQFGITSLRSTATTIVDGIRPRDGRAKTFIGDGRQLSPLNSTPLSPRPRCAIAALISVQDLGREVESQPLVHGRTAVILPTLGRTDKDFQRPANSWCRWEDSMSMVHLSRGNLHPPSDQVCSEVAIVCQRLLALLGPDHPVPWGGVQRRLHLIRDAIADRCFGCADYNTCVPPDGFQLRIRRADSREFPPTPAKRTSCTRRSGSRCLGRLVLQTPAAT